MIAPHTSCRYAIGIHYGAEGTQPRTIIGAVHAILEPGNSWSLLLSRVDEVDRPGEAEPVTTYGMPQIIDGKHLAAMAPNLGEARKVLRAMLAAGPYRRVDG